MRRTYMLAIAVALFAFQPQCFRSAVTIATTIATKAYTIATKANGAENCEESARTKKN
jgi:hypothetical protein